MIWFYVFIVIEYYTDIMLIIINKNIKITIDLCRILPWLEFEVVVVVVDMEIVPVPVSDRFMFDIINETKADIRVYTPG